MTRRKFHNWWLGAAVLVLSCLFAACKEDVDTSARYVFKYDTILSYLQKHEQYSQYVELLGQVPVGPVSTSTLYQLLAARGNYTVFAPTNEAIQNYLDTLAARNVIDEAREFALAWGGDSMERSTA